jgi:hypothetical protein
MATTIRQPDSTTVTIACGPACDDGPNPKRYLRLEVAHRGQGFAVLLEPGTVEQLAEIFARWNEVRA